MKIGNELNEFFFTALEKERKLTFDQNHEQINEILKTNGIDLFDLTKKLENDNNDNNNDLNKNE